MSRFNRRKFLVGLAAALTAYRARAQQQAKVARVGFLFAGTLADRPQAQGFFQGLQELGYAPGKNVVIDVREAAGQPERLPDLARELVRLKPDALVAVTPSAITAAQQATSTIPIVMAISADAIRFGHVRNLARPEGNITGPLIMFDALASEKRLQLLTQMLPRVSRIGAIFNAKASVTSYQRDQIVKLAPSLGVQILQLPFDGPSDIERAFSEAARQRPEALIVVVDPVTSDKRAAIIQFAAKERIPAMYGFADEPLEGGLVGFGVNLREEYRRVAPYVDKLLKGAKPAELPVQQSSKVEFVVNLKTARQLGITVPQLLLLRADRVIE